MSKRPQFSLKALLVIIAVLSVPLAMMGSEDRILFAFGCFVLLLTGGGTLGYLLGGWNYAIVGVLFGWFLALTIPLFLPDLFHGV